MSLGGPALGMAVDVFDDARQAAARRGRRARLHEAVAGHDARPLQGPRALPRDVLVSAGPTCGCTATGRRSTTDGDWFLHGRSDDTIKVAGKRLGPAEVEWRLVSHPAVVEAAAVGVPDELKGEALWAYVVLCAGADADRGAARRARRPRGRPARASFRPSGVRFTTRAPQDPQRQGPAPRHPSRRRSATDPGDLSSLEDPASLEAIRNAK